MAGDIFPSVQKSFEEIKDIVKKYGQRYSKQNKHYSKIQSEFEKQAGLTDFKDKLMNRVNDMMLKSKITDKEKGWWQSLSRDKQQKYLSQHPQSKLRFVNPF